MVEKGQKQRQIDKILASKGSPAVVWGGEKGFVRHLFSFSLNAEPGSSNG